MQPSQKQKEYHRFLNLQMHKKATHEEPKDHKVQNVPTTNNVLENVSKELPKDDQGEQNHEDSIVQAQHEEAKKQRSISS